MLKEQKSVRGPLIKASFNTVQCSQGSLNLMHLGKSCS